MRREDQERILTEVQSRVVHAQVAAAEAGGQPLDELLAESIYHELRRLKEDRAALGHSDDTAFWQRIHGRLNRASEREQRALLAQVVRRYVREVCGNFDPRVYKVATRLVPAAMGLLLNASSPRRLLARLPELPSVDDAIVVQGETEHLRRLHEVGTVILAPTHVSNMDSIVLGFAIYRLGLPAFIYGAGLNLFSNPLMSFFMRNLGAYTVDRRKRDPLYKEVLKSYAALTLEYGYDNLFFPGGTRARSGAIERKLKLGLVGTSLAAYVSNLRRKASRPKVFVVPATLSFQLVLEAETLIDDFLREVGKSRYIISDDEFSEPRRVYDFATQLFSLDSRIFVTLGRGLDPFGNPVDDDGESLDPRGRRVDIEHYVSVDGEPRILPQRDAQYTAEVGERLMQAYGRDNVVQATHIAARGILNLLRRHNPGTDLVRLLRVGGRQPDFEIREAHREIATLLQELRTRAAAGRVRMAPSVANAAADDVLADGLRHFAIYHTSPAATRRGDRIFPGDRSLLFYYQNRLEGYGLGRADGMPAALSGDHRTLGAAA